MSGIFTYPSITSDSSPIIFLPETGTTYFDSNSQKTYLRTGTIAQSSLYPTVATNELLMVHGASVTGSLPTANITSYATNGTGTILLATGDATNIWRSTNYGQTWAAVAHGNANPVTAVVWTGAQFVGLGNSASAITSRVSTDGLTWSAGGSAAVTTATANTTRAAHDGTNGVAVCQSSSTAQACRFTNGVTLTAVSLSQAINAQPTIAVNTGAGRWLVMGFGVTTASQSTTADGSAWTNRTVPNANGLTAGNGLFVTASSSVGISSSPDGVTWTTYQIPGSSLDSGSLYSTVYSATPTNFPVQFDAANGVFVFSSSATASSPITQFAYGSDLTQLRFRQHRPITGGVSIVLPVSSHLLILAQNASTGGVWRAANWFTSSEYVGSVLPVTNQPATPAQNSRRMVGYMKVT